MSGTKKNEALSRLVTILTQLKDFKKSVYKGFRTHIKVPKAILIHLIADTQQPETTHEIRHLMTINCLVRIRKDIGADPEKEMESFINTVGNVEDKLLSYKQDVWDELRIREIRYTFREERQMVYYNALMILEVEMTW